MAAVEFELVQRRRVAVQLAEDLEHPTYVSAANGRLQLVRRGALIVQRTQKFFAFVFSPYPPARKENVFVH